MLSMGKKSGEFVARGLWPSRLMVASNSLNPATNLTAVWSKHLFSKVLYSDLLLCRFHVNGCVQIIDKYNFVYTILCDSFSWVIAHVYIRNGNMLHHHFINKISVSLLILEDVGTTKWDHRGIGVGICMEWLPKRDPFSACQDSSNAQLLAKNWAVDGLVGKKVLEYDVLFRGQTFCFSRFYHQY